MPSKNNNNNDPLSNSLKNLKISTASHGLRPRYSRRDQLQNGLNQENSSEFISVLSSSKNHQNSSSLRSSNAISPGRKPSNREKAKSPGRDTCRFLPPRETLNTGLASHRANFGLEKKSKDENQLRYQETIEKISKNSNIDNEELSRHLDWEENENDEAKSRENRIINFQAQAPRSDVTKKSNSIFSTCSSAKLQRRAKVSRRIPTDCSKVLDAPELRSDYYNNPLDWSPSQNILAVALGPNIYLWNPETGDAEELDISSICDANQYVSCLRFIRGAGGPTMAIGINSSDMYLFDIEKGKKLRKMSGHPDLVNAMDWREYILSASSNDGSIFHHDVRQREHHVGSFLKHTSSVPGLGWSTFGGSYLASGGNDNSCFVWDHRKIMEKTGVKPIQEFESHVACVKAVAWSPRAQHVLASGGGTADRTIKLWNVATGNEINSIETGSQVCSIVFSKNYRKFKKRDRNFWFFVELIFYIFCMMNLCQHTVINTINSLYGVILQAKRFRIYMGTMSAFCIWYQVQMGLSSVVGARMKH